MSRYLIFTVAHQKFLLERCLPSQLAESQKGVMEEDLPCDLQQKISSAILCMYFLLTAEIFQ